MSETHMPSVLRGLHPGTVIQAHECAVLSVRHLCDLCVHYRCVIMHGAGAEGGAVRCMMMDCTRIYTLNMHFWFFFLMGVWVGPRVCVG